MMHSSMPPRAPLDMPAQDFSRAPSQADAGTERQDPIWRMAVFLPALAITGLTLWGLYGLFEMSGMTSFEYVLLALIGLTFIWVTIAVSTVGVGLAGRLDPTRKPAPADPLDVALLVPI